MRARFIAHEAILIENAISAQIRREVYGYSIGRQRAMLHRPSWKGQWDRIPLSATSVGAIQRRLRPGTHVERPMLQTIASIVLELP